MKMIKRMAAAVLAAVMAMVVLTACSSISPTQEKVRNELNEARAQNGVAALEWSEEANAHARDFANEYQMAATNRLLMPGVETVFLMPSAQYQFVKGSLVREIVRMGGSVSAFVAPAATKALAAKLRTRD